MRMLVKNMVMVGTEEEEEANNVIDLNQKPLLSQRHQRSPSRHQSQSPHQSLNRHLRVISSLNLNQKGGVEVAEGGEETVEGETDDSFKSF